MRLQCKRINNSKSFKISVLIGILLAVFQLLHYKLLGIEASYDEETMTPLVCWFTYLGRDIQLFYRSFFYVIFPIMVCLPNVTRPYQDKVKGYDKQLLIRCSRKKYAVANYMVTAMYGGFVVSLPLALSIFLHMGCVNASKPNEMCLQAEPGLQDMFCNLFYEHPLLYVIVMIIINFLVGACVSGLTLCFSLFTKKLYSIYMFAFVLWVMQQSMFAKLDIDTWCFANIAAPITEHVYLMPCVILIGATLIGTFIIFTGVTVRRDVL